jgi:hypothetical protein
MIMSRHPYLGHNENTRIAKKSFEKMAKFKYLGMILKNQNDIHSGNACYYSVHNLLSSRLIPKNPRIKI